MSLQFFFLFSIVACCCDWPTLTNAEPYGFSAATKEIPVGNGNFISASSSSFGTGSVSAAAAASSSFAGLTQDQIDGQLAGLRTGEMISINNVRYMALRTEDDPATARRDTIILVQVAGQSDASLNSGDSYTAAISHLNGRVPDESTTGNRVGHYNSAPSSISDNRANIIGDETSVGSSSAPYSPAIIRQETNAVAGASVNGGAGVNDPSSSSSYSSPAEWMAGNVDRQSVSRERECNQKVSSSYFSLFVRALFSDSSSSSLSINKFVLSVTSECGLAIFFYANHTHVYLIPMPPKKFILIASGGLVQSTDAGRDRSSSSYSSAGRIRPNNGHEEKWDYSKSIPGVAGRDYPILSAVVPTSFSCNGRKDGGYYADVESACQVYHVCALDKTFSFLCPNGTIFDQRVFVCRWWHNVDCASSAKYYNLNDLIGISPATQQPAVRNPIHFPSATSYEPAAAAPTKLVVQQQQPIQSSTTGVSQKPLKQIYGPPPSSAVLQSVLIEEAIRRPSSGLKAPAIQPTASSAY
ncbi:uncharacterized protein LOC124191573 isoform X1 [Daphnia pulex]|uniref:uncharacterized protein LOC124191573 isoform X1 n=1 Tax=Daphnia pulex TaxID=6669 RepID=UPI001EE1012E|nr:uncharacterized protein LOC124191573 isoform X1 [Daphnia pulex]